MFKRKTLIILVVLFAFVRTSYAQLEIKATLKAIPESYSGRCPTTIKFEGEISVKNITSRILTVRYKFIRSDGASGPVEALIFRRDGTIRVSDTWSIGPTPKIGEEYEYWEAIKIVSPQVVESNKANFKIRCMAEHEAHPIRQYEVPWILLSRIFGPMSIHIDHRGSWFKLKIGTFEKTIPLYIGSFVAKGPAGMRDIKHNLQDINCDRTFINLANSKLFMTFTCETNGMEIKRYAKGALGEWNDNLAFDINLTEFRFTPSFRIGSERALFLSRENIINDANVDVRLQAEVSNVPDWMEIWGIVDGRVTQETKEQIIKALSDSELKAKLYEAIMQVVGSIPALQNIEIVNAYSWGDKLVVVYRTR